jgi:thiol-disulfide isomerase/thioredoxin
MRPAAVLLAASLSCCAAGGIVADVRDAIARKDFAAGERLVAAYRARAGVTPELAEAVSWLGRGALAASKLDDAARFAAETRALALDLLKTRKLDEERRLPIALGASIEVHAQALAARGERSEAVAFLNQELARWSATSMHERIRKNLHLLTLEGKPAPAIHAARWLGPKPPATLKGRPYVIFLWAHWCGDCKSMAGPLAALQKKYAARNLAVLGPTRLYGYAARGEDAAPDAELAYIDQVRQRFYGAVTGMSAPVDKAIFEAYGVSTTPTLVLVDRAGLVRLYHPGAMSEAELDARIAAMLAK